MNKRLSGILFLIAAFCFFIVATFADAPGAFIAIGCAFVAIGATMLARAKASNASHNR